MPDEARDSEQSFITLFLLAKALAVRRFTAADRTGQVAAGCVVACSSNDNSGLPELGGAVGSYLGLLEQELSVLQQLVLADDIPADAHHRYSGQLLDRKAEMAAVRLAWRTLSRRFQPADRRVDAIRALTWIAAGSPANFPKDPDH